MLGHGRAAHGHGRGAHAHLVVELVALREGHRRLVHPVQGRAGRIGGRGGIRRVSPLARPAAQTVAQTRGDDVDEVADLEAAVRAGAAPLARPHLLCQYHVRQRSSHLSPQQRQPLRPQVEVPQVGIQHPHRTHSRDGGGGGGGGCCGGAGGC